VTEIPADFVRAIGRVRPVSLLLLLVGVGASVAAGVWAIGVGLAVTTLLLLGPMVEYLKRRMNTRSDTTAPPSSGTMTIAGILGSLPALIVGVVCVVASAKYWWVGFPAGAFLGIALADVAFYTAAISVIRKHQREHTATAPP